MQFDLFYLQRSKGDDCYLVDLYSSIDDTAVLLAGSYGEDGWVTDYISNTRLLDNRIYRSDSLFSNILNDQKVNLTTVGLVVKAVACCRFKSHVGQYFVFHKCLIRVCSLCPFHVKSLAVQDVYCICRQELLVFKIKTYGTRGLPQ